tara:strand:- start:2269 stop:3048 length:780 start_codon:yes stop_codon:yes gene_type:complete
MLIDIHCHLDHPLIYSKVDEIIQESKKNKVKTIITCGLNKSSNRLALELSKKYSIVKCSLGIYPIDALQKEISPGDYGYLKEPFNIDEELEFIRQHKDEIIAIGEIGMDLKTGKDEQAQESLFVKQLKLAEKLDKPVIIHSRKAEDKVFEILQKTHLKKVVMHCFGGKLKLVKKIADKGYYFSIPPSITRSEHFQKIVETVNISQLLTETDAPYQSPYKDKINKPHYVIETIKKIAEIKGMEPEEVEKIIFMNFQRVFL